MGSSSGYCDRGTEMNDQAGPQDDGAQPSSEGLATTRQRRLFVLSGQEELTGAATAAWGVLGIEGQMATGPGGATSPGSP